jgi:hypothetical protein
VNPLSILIFFGKIEKNVLQQLYVTPDLLAHGKVNPTTQKYTCLSITQSEGEKT